MTTIVPSLYMLYIYSCAIYPDSNTEEVYICSYSVVDIVCCITMLRNKSDIYGYFITATTSSQSFLNSKLCREKAVVLSIFVIECPLYIAHAVFYMAYLCMFVPGFIVMIEGSNCICNSTYQYPLNLLKMIVQSEKETTHNDT